MMAIIISMAMMMMLATMPVQLLVAMALIIIKTVHFMTVWNVKMMATTVKKAKMAMMVVMTCMPMMVKTMAVLRRTLTMPLAMPHRLPTLIRMMVILVSAITVQISICKN